MASFDEFRALLPLVRDHLPAEILDLHAVDMAKLLEAVVWLRQDRPHRRRTLEVLVYGVADLQGLPRVGMPSHWVAAVIACFVHPINYMAACYDLATYTHDMLDDDSTAPGDRVQKVTATKLFSQVTNLAAGSETEVKAARASMASRLESVLPTG